MKLIGNYVSLLIMVAFMLSCSRDDSSTLGGTGKLSFKNIGVNTEVISTVASSRVSEGQEDTTPEVKSMEDYVKEGFSLTVYTHANPVTVYQCNNYEEYKSGKCEEIELRAGYYDIITVLGNPSLEGFDLPCYSDTIPSREKDSEELPVHIKNGEETSVNFECKLLNSIFNIKYTENFKKYFSTYSSSVSTSLGNSIVFAMDEVRSAYMAPGEVTVYVTAKKEGAKESTFNVGAYKLSAQYEYSLTIDVDASSAMMTITFSDDVSDAESITIDVSDAALNAAAPRFSSESIVSGEQISIIEGEKVDDSFVVSVNAEGLISRCELTTNSEYLIGKGWPSNIDLVSASVDDINKVKALGFEFKGLGVETWQMAYMDFTGMIRELPKENPIEININVTDKFGKTSVTPFVVSAVTEDCKFNVTPTAEEVKFLGNECKVNVSFRTGNPSDIKFALADGKVLDILNVEESGSTEELKNYVVTLKAADDVQFINPFSVNAKYLSYDKNTDNLSVSYGILIDEEGDVWAKRAVLHVYNTELDGITIQKQDGESWTDIDNSSIEIDGTDAIVKGLTSNTAYRFRAVKAEKEPTNEVEAMTEEELQVPNAGFEEWHNKHIWTGSSGFPYVGGDVPMYSFYPYIEGEKDIWWSTRNDYTTSKAGEFSYYYVVYPGTIQLPSDWSAAGKIGYPNSPCVGNSSAEIATVGHGEGSTCTTGWVLGDKMECKKHTSGALFTGFYENGNENLGKEFGTRPNKMTFVYRLHTVNGESASALIRLENRSNGEVVNIGEGVLTLSEARSSNEDAEVEIIYTNKVLKATHIVIYFTSSTSSNPSIIPYYVSDNFNGNRYSRGIGNVLTIDDIKLIYE